MKKLFIMLISLIIGSNVVFISNKTTNLINEESSKVKIEKLSTNNFYKKYNLIKPSFDIDLSSTDGLLTYLLWYYETYVIGHTITGITVYESSFKNAKVLETNHFFTTFTEDLGKKIIKTSDLSYKNYGFLQQEYVTDKLSVTHTITNTVTIEHSWKISIKATTKLPFPFLTENMSAELTKEYAGKTVNTRTVTDTVTMEIPGQKYQIPGEHQLTGKILVYEKIMKDVGYFDGIIDSNSKISYQVKNNWSNLRNFSISYGELLESVQYHSKNIYKFITTFPNVAFSLVNGYYAKDTIIKDDKGFAKVVIPSWCIYKAVSHTADTKIIQL